MNMPTGTTSDGGGDGENRDGDGLNDGGAEKITRKHLF
jgi:hypothetical protein